MSNHKYKATYQVVRHPEGVTREQVPDGQGACDAMLLASIIYPEDGSLSVMFVGHDGRTDTDLADSEWFKVWAMLSARLAKSETLSNAKREFCATVHEVFCAGVGAAASARKDPP